MFDDKSSQLHLSSLVNVLRSFRFLCEPLHTPYCTAKALPGSRSCASPTLHRTLCVHTQKNLAIAETTLNTCYYNKQKSDSSALSYSVLMPCCNGCRNVMSACFTSFAPPGAEVLISTQPCGKTASLTPRFNCTRGKHFSCAVRTQL